MQKQVAAVRESATTGFMKNSRVKVVIFGASIDLIQSDIGADHSISSGLGAFQCQHQSILLAPITS